MYNVLKKFLSLYHHLALLGIGNFNVEEIPASIDIANRCIHPPAFKINFSDEKLAADKTFFHFAAQELNIDEVQAIRSFTDFTAQLQQDIKEDKPVVLNNIGRLYKQSADKLKFEVDAMPEYLPVLTAERVIRKNATHTIMVGEDEKTSDEMHAALNEEEVAEVDRWWIPAIVLGLIGIAALIYYYNVLHPTHF